MSHVVLIVTIRIVRGARGVLGFGEETVTDAADSEQVDGLGGIGFEVAAEADDEVVDGAGVGVFFDVPDILEELGAGDDLAGVVQEIAQEVGFHEGEMDGLVGWSCGSCERISRVSRSMVRPARV